MGHGDDPGFILFSFEHAWQVIRTEGAGFLWSAAFAKAPIFHPFPNSFYLSDTLAIPALLGLPLRLVTRHPAVTLQLLAMLTSFAAFLSARAWLRSLGYRQFAAWVALLFAACGWIQEHYAHYQNTFIFLFPLAMWRLEEWRLTPTWRNTVLAAVFCGWGFGWSVYFQLFLNLGVVGWILFGLSRRPLVFTQRTQQAQLAAFAIMTVLIQLPFAVGYIEAASGAGSFDVNPDVFFPFTATWRAFIAHAEHPSLLQRLVGVYPNPHTGIESVGFIGLVWQLMVFVGAARMKTRSAVIWAVLYGLFWMVSLGPRTPIFDWLTVFPGIGAARAIGRAQILVTLFALPLLAEGLQFLTERTRPGVASLIVAAIAVELVPGSLPKSVALPREWHDWDANPSALEQAAPELRHDAGTNGWYVLGVEPAAAQFGLMRTGLELSRGYSGRVPQGFEAREELKDKLELLLGLHIDRFLTPDPAFSDRLDRLGAIQRVGCYEHLQRTWCAYKRR